MTPLSHMNKAQRAVALFPSKTEMARVINRDPARITRMMKAGRIPGTFNLVLLEWADENGCLDEISACLEPLCPCCGKELT